MGGVCADKAERLRWILGTKSDVVVYGARFNKRIMFASHGRASFATSSSSKLSLVSIFSWYYQLSVSRATRPLCVTALAPRFQSKSTKMTREVTVVYI